MLLVGTAATADHTTSAATATVVGTTPTADPKTSATSTVVGTGASADPTTSAATATCATGASDATTIIPSSTAAIDINDDDPTTSAIEDWDPSSVVQKHVKSKTCKLFHTPISMPNTHVHV